MNNRIIKKTTGNLHSVEDCQPIRIVKSDHAQNLLNPTKVESAMSAAPTQPVHRHAPEIHLLATGPDYCDIEVICGCGESSRVRCWNSLNEQSKVAA